MNQGKYVFAQISSFLPQRFFDRIVSKYKGNYKIRHFTCWNQMLCMMFGQLSNRESLSDLVLTINAHPAKLYHLGFGKGISKTNLAKANEQRPWLIYEEFAYHLIGEAREICLPDTNNAFSFTDSVYAFDSTTIDLCLSVFCWATFRRAKGAVKLHTQYDVRTSIPVFMHVSAGSVHDVNVMDKITYEQGSFYIFDRGYLDFERLYFIQQSKSFFVIRAKNNLKFKRMYSSAVDKTKGVCCDQTGYLKGFYSLQGYPKKIRRIKFYDEQQGRTFVFLTNNMELKPEEIAAIYKYRWKIELFFKWIKQHLKITAFWGRTENAVKTQVYIAIITYSLVAIIKQQLKSGYSTYEILQILGTSLLDKTQINQLLQKKNNQDVKELLYNQLKIF
jgi:transposase